MIIGLVGFQRVGKSTAAKYLEDKYGFVRHNMKDALVAEIKERFPELLEEVANVYNDAGYNVKLTPENLFELKPPLMRALLQNYGTNVRRADRADYWTNEWQAHLAYLRTIGDTNFVVDDVRFFNEAVTVWDNFGTLIRLTRPDVTTGGTHQSETEQLEIEVDYTIETRAGDTESLYREFDRILNELK